MDNLKLWTLITCLYLALHGVLAAANETPLQRGAHVATEVCNSCHGLKYLKYSDFIKLGFTKAQVDSMRGDKSMSDPLTAQMAPNDALSAFGIVPPDLTLMAKAREGGVGYIDSMITGFYTDANGNIANHVFPGIKMPDILGISQADPESRKALQLKAKDVSDFLGWAADPQAETRENIGYGVIGYVFVLTILFYLLKNKIWGRLNQIHSTRSHKS
ncbi:MAG: cytochrome C [Ferrovum sp.]|nr:cytochrome C [Ferrovum sp.]